MSFATKVRALLKSRKMNQTELGEAIGTSQQTVSRWLELDTPPKADYLLKIARALGTTVDHLIDDSQDSPPLRFAAVDFRDDAVLRRYLP